MAILTIPNTFVNGTTAVASEVNANFTAVKTFAEGLSSGANLDENAVTSSKLAANAVTTAKILDGSVTFAKLDAGVSAQLAAGDSDAVVIGSQVFS